MVGPGHWGSGHDNGESQLRSFSTGTGSQQLGHNPEKLHSSQGMWVGTLGEEGHVQGEKRLDPGKVTKNGHRLRGPEKNHVWKLGRQGLSLAQE